MGKIQHFMDSRGACKEVSDELARELLIAISHPVPEQVLDLSFVPRDRVLVANGDGDENHTESNRIKKLLVISVINLHIIKMRMAIGPNVIAILIVLFENRIASAPHRFRFGLLRLCHLKRVFVLSKKKSKRNFIR
ncbi:hypothetical protein Prudu_013639 [Prunus dulcis]|uniref:Uncharacterized protein n=1 Tax=Prunus dulcis TaxID=3755 RepID=A0A4Y1RF83_PRUDU|nr:hypothetical protein Prudu_013639 [Prunus dulcis]